MSLVVLDNVSLGFGARSVVEGLDLRIGEHDRIGLVGPNGAGKTTLLRLVAGEMSPEKGAIETARRLRTGYLPQEIASGGGVGLLAYLRESVPGRADLGRELAAAELELEQAHAKGDDSRWMDLGSRIAELHEQIAHFDEHYSDHQALGILAGLGFAPADRDRDVGEFSGGWRMRARLAALLFQRPDLLLLDEPTNHLDMPSVAWFESFLDAYDGAFVLVCHDREFLNEQIDRVISFEPEGLRTYAGNYEKYLLQRAEEEIILENRAKNLARERERAERFIERFRAQATKARAVQSRVKALDRMQDVQTYQKRKTMRFRFPPCARAGEEVVRVRGIRKAFGEHVVFGGLDLTVRRGERIAILGVNGAGKTTLLKLMAGELAPEAGRIELGHNVTPSYYAQHHAETLHPKNTAYQEVASREPSGNRTRIQSILGAFLFSGDDVDKLVQILSGGERARVALARMLVAPGNLLLMDEPTNHLDLDSSEALADALGGYDGTLVFVSHNLSFVRKLASRIWNVEDGRVETYPGTLDEYLVHCRERGEAQTRSEAQEKRAPRTREQEQARKRAEAELRNERNRKLKPLRVEVERIEGQIAALEAVQKERAERLADPAVWASSEGAELTEAYQTDADGLARLLADWEAAQAALEIEIEQAQAGLQGTRAGGD